MRFVVRSSANSGISGPVLVAVLAAFGALLLLAPTSSAGGGGPSADSLQLAAGGPAPGALAAAMPGATVGPGARRPGRTTSA